MWQSIETAPKDGTKILVCRADEFPESVEVTHWCEMQFHKYEEAGNGLYRRVEEPAYKFWNNNGHRATHWMSLPEPPK